MSLYLRSGNGGAYCVPNTLHNRELGGQMGLSSEALQWWQEWQLRILVLSSLFLQYFLFLCSPLRKRCIPDCVRFFIWLTYLGSDAIALYALATLFYSPRNLRLGVRVLRCI